MHYRTPPESMRDDPPSSDVCWLLHCPCWHDGSSLAVEEKWIPLWLTRPNDHDEMFLDLCLFADEVFNEAESKR